MTVRALVVGSLVADLAFWVPKRPGPGEVVIATDHGSYRGGKGYNQAVALARLGAEVSFVGAVGTDAEGDGFLAALRREGIDVSRVLQLRGCRTGTAVPLVTPDGDVGFVQCPGANWQIAPAHVADLPDCDLLLLQGEVAAVTSRYAARVIRRRGGIVLLKPAPVAEITPELLDAASVLCPNEVESRALLSNAGRGWKNDLDLARGLVVPGRATAVTLGGRGAVWADGEDAGSVPPPRVDVVDATGASAAFCAMLGMSLAEGEAFPDAVAAACAAGAVAGTRHGAEPSLPTRHEVNTLLVGQR